MTCKVYRRNAFADIEKDCQHAGCGTSGPKHIYGPRVAVAEAPDIFMQQQEPDDSGNAPTQNEQAVSHMKSKFISLHLWSPTREIANNIFFSVKTVKQTAIFIDFLP